MLKKFPQFCWLLTSAEQHFKPKVIEINLLIFFNLLDNFFVASLPTSTHAHSQKHGTFESVHNFASVMQMLNCRLGQ